MPESIILQKRQLKQKCPLIHNIRVAAKKMIFCTLEIKFTPKESNLEKDAEREGEGDGHQHPAEAEQEPAKHPDAGAGVLSVICQHCQFTYFFKTNILPFWRASASFNIIPFITQSGFSDLIVNKGFLNQKMTDHCCLKHKGQDFWSKDYRDNIIEDNFSLLWKVLTISLICAV